MVQSIYERLLADAEDSKRTHHERMAKLTRAHFERHPECLYVIVRVDQWGNTIRSKDRLINVEVRCMEGWASDAMLKANIDPQRPLEAQAEKVEATPPQWQFPGERKAVNVSEYMKQRHVPALKQAAARGDLNQYNTYISERRFQQRMSATSTPML